MVDFGAIIDKLVNIGFYKVVLPFILVYVVIFAILEKSKIFSNGSSDAEEKSLVKNVNAVIAFVFGLFVVASIQTVTYIQSFITSTIIFVFFILVVFILLGFILGEEYKTLFFKKDKDGKFTEYRTGLIFSVAGIVVLVAVIKLMITFDVWNKTVEWFTDLLDFNSGDLWSVVAVVGIVVILVWVSGGFNKSNENSGGKTPETKK